MLWRGVLLVKRLLLLAVLVAVAAYAGVTHVPWNPPHAKPTTVDAPATTPGQAYSRDAFGDGWADLDHDGCKTRDEILARDLTHPELEDGCDVKAGILHDPYTGTTIHFNDARYWTVDIDHIYPLHLAWENGADEWSPEKRVRFANDPRNLLAVQAGANRSKGDSGPGEWVPANRAFACDYAWSYTLVALTYGLPATRDDVASLDALHDTCPGVRATQAD